MSGEAAAVNKWELAALLVAILIVLLMVSLGYTDGMPAL